MVSPVIKCTQQNANKFPLSRSKAGKAVGAVLILAGVIVGKLRSMDEQNLTQPFNRESGQVSDLG